VSLLPHRQRKHTRPAGRPTQVCILLEMKDEADAASSGTGIRQTYYSTNLTISSADVQIWLRVEGKIGSPSSLAKLAYERYGLMSEEPYSE